MKFKKNNNKNTIEYFAYCACPYSMSSCTCSLCSCTCSGSRHFQSEYDKKYSPYYETRFVGTGNRYTEEMSYRS